MLDANEMLNDELYPEDVSPLSPAKMKKVLASDPKFQSEMKACLDQLEKMPGLRAKVFKDVGQMAT